MSPKRSKKKPVAAGNSSQIEERRQRAAAMRARDAKRDRQRRVAIITIATVVILAIVAAIAIVIVRQQDDASSKSSATPPGVTSSDGGYVLPGTPKSGAPTLDIWEDFQCPACKALEEAQGKTIVDLAASGDAKVVVHMVTLIGDNNIGNEWSQRAAEAAAAAAVQGKFVEFHSITYANQPQEGVGFTDDELESYARQAGVSDMGQWKQAYDSREFEAYVKRVEARAVNQDKIQGTPTLRVGTREIEFSDAVSASPEAFKNLVLQ